MKFQSRNLELNTIITQYLKIFKNIKTGSIPWKYAYCLEVYVIRGQNDFRPPLAFCKGERLVTWGPGIETGVPYLYSTTWGQTDRECFYLDIEKALQFVRGCKYPDCNWALWSVI